MTPGPELDALVAETVMGSTLSRWPVLQFDGTAKEELVFWDGPKMMRLPPYSTDIAAAWEVVENFVAKLAFSGENGFVLDYSCGSWTATFRHSISEFGKSVESLADTAPHAICLAALKAVGVDV